MRSYNLLTLLQLTTVLALFVIGATAYYAWQENVPKETAGICGVTASDYPFMDIGEYNKGKTLWNANACGACHWKNMKEDGTGPALSGVEERWAGEPREHLHAWVRNSVALAESGRSPRATEMVNWSPAAMSPFPHLDSLDIEALLDYVEGQYGSIVIN